MDDILRYISPFIFYLFYFILFYKIRQTYNRHK
jgi:hypothetical protein